MMIMVQEKIVLGMAVMRFVSSLFELTAAVLILKFDNIQTALKINALLALIGPTIMTLVMMLGLSGLSGKIPVGKFLLILTGVVLIFIGVTKSR
jgi:hypothetical protein